MSRESILKIRETEQQAQRLVENAHHRAERMLEEAEARGKLLCEQTERETTEEMRELLLRLKEKTDEMDQRALSEAEEELEQLRKNARLNRKIAEKIVIRGLDAKCR